MGNLDDGIALLRNDTIGVVTIQYYTIPTRRPQREPVFESKRKEEKRRKKKKRKIWMFFSAVIQQGWELRAFFGRLIRTFTAYTTMSTCQHA
jgi:hypothetical protein